MKAIITCRHSIFIVFLPVVVLRIKPF